jgi:AraC-like DNA-binding protein
MEDDLMTKHATGSEGDAAVADRDDGTPGPDARERTLAARAPRAARAVGPREATFHPAYVRQICARLRDDGRDVDWVLSAGDLGEVDLDRPDRMLPFERVRRLVHAAAFAAGRPSFALELGRDCRLPLLGGFGYAVATAPSVATALAVVERFSGLRNRAVRVAIERRASGLRVTLEPGFDLGDVRRFVLERATAAVLEMVRTVAGRPLAGVVLQVPGPAPAWRGAYDTPGVSVRFDMPAFAIEVPASVVDQPTTAGSAHEFACAWKECETAERRQREALTFGARIAELLAREGPIDLEAAADRLAMSTRTLIRRLRSEDLTFQALREDYRREQALRLLQDRSLTVADIATRLGYVDGSNFSRTFRRWFGATPVEVRIGRVAWPSARPA